MDYSAAIAEGLNISFIDLLEQIQAKFGDKEFVCKKLKSARRHNWQVAATSAKVPLMSTLYEALTKMAKEYDPCIRILDVSGNAFANGSAQFIKLPPLRGKEAVRKISKEALVAETAQLRTENARLKKAMEEIQLELKRQTQLKENYQSRVGEVELAEEDYKDFPPCFETNDFREFLKEHKKANGKRPNFKAAGLWGPIIAAHIPFITTWVVHEEQLLVAKQPVRSQRRVKEGVIAAKASRRGADCKTAVCQFFQFVAMTTGRTERDFIPSESHLLSKITINAFFTFYGQHAGSPNSAGNKAKFFISLFKFMATIERLRRYSAVIELILMELRKYCNIKKVQNSLHHSQNCLDLHLLLKGEWLEPAELSILNQFVSKEIVDFLSASERGRNQSELEVYRFQKSLLLFCYLQTGGQRREVIVNFAVDNLAMIEDKVIHFTLDEKVQKRKTDRLTLPDTVGQLLRIWIERYRSKLVPKDSKVMSVFVARDGKPLQPRRVTEFVKKKVAQCFPGRIVTPLSLRRILVTEMALVMMSNPNDFFCWAARHAVLINTSDKVLLMNYNRASQSKQSAETLEKINTSLNLVPMQAVQDAINEHASTITFLRKEGEEVEEVIDIRFVDGLRQYLCKMANQTEEWKPYTHLAKAANQVVAYLKKTALAKSQQGKDMPSLESDEEESEHDEIECDCCIHSENAEDAESDEEDCQLEH